MHRLTIIAAVLFAPTAAFGHASAPGASPPAAPPASPATAGLYGPPAPVAAPVGSGPAAATPKPASDGAQPATRHRGRRRGNAYAGTDLGLGR